MLPFCNCNHYCVSMWVTVQVSNGSQVELTAQWYHTLTHGNLINQMQVAFVHRQSQGDKVRHEAGIALRVLSSNSCR